MDPKCTQLEKFSVGFVRLMKEYNNYCKPSQRLDDQQMLTYYERYIRRVPRLRDLKTQMNTTDRLAKSQGQSPMPVATRLQNYLSNTIILDGDYKKAMLASKRHANFGMIYSGDMDISNILDVDVHAAQSIPDGYVDPGITTFDVNDTAFAEDDDRSKKRHSLHALSRLHLMGVRLDHQIPICRCLPTYTSSISTYLTSL